MYNSMGEGRLPVFLRKMQGTDSGQKIIFNLCLKLRNMFM